MQATQANPISDLTFDWITVLQSKAEGIHAYEKYIADAERENSPECAELFRRLWEQDVRQVEEIRGHVLRMLEQQGR